VFVCVCFCVCVCVCVCMCVCVRARARAQQRELCVRACVAAARERKCGYQNGQPRQLD